MPVLILIAICALTWGLVKQASRTFDKPEWWDMADPVAGVVGFVGFAYVNHPFVGHHGDPLLVLIYNAGTFGIGTVVLTMMLGLGAEDAGLIRTPEGLAPIDARFHEQVSSLDELDDGTLAEYTEEA